MTDPKLKEGQEVICPECGKKMRLRISTFFTYRNGQPRKYWRCKDMACSGKHSAHPNGLPLGIPANKDLRQLRTYLHILMEQMFDNNDDSHRWIANNMPVGHVSDMNELQCWEAIRKLEGLEK